MRESVTHNLQADEARTHRDNVDSVERSGWAGRLRSVLMPLPRAGGFYASSWGDFLLRKSNDQVPVVRPTVALAGHALLDEIVIAGFHAFLSPSDASALARVGRETLAALEIFESAGWLDRPESFFEAPAPLDDVTIETVGGRRFSYERLSFVSGYKPHLDEPGRERWLGYAENRLARAWLLRHDEPRPWLVCVHGAQMGRPSIDLALFRARWLHEELGLNVLFPVLPLHGPRAHGVSRTTRFPGEDVLDNIHGTAQGVWDIRRLLTWTRSICGDKPIGISGISLGGYTTSPVASLEEGLTCAIAGVPAVGLMDLLEQHAGLHPKNPLAEILTPAKRRGRAISPLALTPRVPPEGRFIYAGLADRLLYPRDHVIRLWEHWGRPEIAWYEGGHTGFARSKPVQKFVHRALVQSGLVKPSTLRATA